VDFRVDDSAGELTEGIAVIMTPTTRNRSQISGSNRGRNKIPCSLPNGFGPGPW